MSDPVLDVKPYVVLIGLASMVTGYDLPTTRFPRDKLAGADKGYTIGLWTAHSRCYLPESAIPALLSSVSLWANLTMIWIKGLSFCHHRPGNR